MRSYVMSRVKSKDTKPELALRKELFSRGLRYRLHVNNLPGKPDLVFKKYRAVVFVHGCFWHLHNACRDGRIPKSKLDYWKPKLERNQERDVINEKTLALSGWSVIIVWECEIKKNLTQVAEKISQFILGNLK